MIKIDSTNIIFSDGTTKTVSMEDLKDLYHELHKLFGESIPIRVTSKPWPLPWGQTYPSVIPQEPQRQTNPFIDKTEIWCKDSFGDK